MSDRPIPSAFSLEHAAHAIARKEGLIDDAGQLHCWNCRKPCGWHVSLHCDPCRYAVIDRLAAQKAEAAREHPETKRWRAIHRDMTEDQRLNQETALNLIRNCEKLSSATFERRAELQRRFDERFGKHHAAPSGRRFVDDD